MLSKDGRCRLRRKLYCPDTGKEYDFTDTTRGLEVAPDQYVIVDEKEMENLKPEKGRTIEIEQFVERDEAEEHVRFVKQSYYLEPDKIGRKARHA